MRGKVTWKNKIGASSVGKSETDWLELTVKKEKKLEELKEKMEERPEVTLKYYS